MSKYQNLWSHKKNLRNQNKLERSWCSGSRKLKSKNRRGRHDDELQIIRTNPRTTHLAYRKNLGC